MLIKVQYSNAADREMAILNHKDKQLVEEQNISDGNFLIFSEEIVVNVTELRLRTAEQIQQALDAYTLELMEAGRI